MHKNANRQHSYSPTVLGREPGLEHECEANAGKFSLKDGPLENLWGGEVDEVQKKNSRKGKLNEKKFLHAN